MGNQESVSSNDTYVVKKKKNPITNNQKNIKKVNNEEYNHQYNQQYNHQHNQQHNQQYNQQHNQQHSNQQQKNKNIHNIQKSNNINTRHESFQNNYLNDPIYMQQSSKPKFVEYTDYNGSEKLIEKQYNNSALMERSVLSDVYAKNNHVRMMDYPSNSNNQLSIPKVNIDNMEFTPYNFKEEVDKFKKSINIERDEFENIEKERRNKYETQEKMKKDYLNKQIKLFETEYDPWKILGLEYQDYNINNIKKAYKKNALKYHPDRAGLKYNDKFQLITQAYIYLLGKVDENNIIDKKINTNVENIDYEDNVNDSVENIYIDKDKFDISKFNTIFEQYKIPTTFDKGYGDLLKGKIEEDDSSVFGQKFNNDIFNAHFDNKKKNKKKSLDVIEYLEPNALDSSSGNLNHSILGMDDMDDFGCVNGSGLSYTDFKKAHIDENLLIDANKVKYKTYNSIEQLESDRSKLSYTLTPEDKQRQEYMERKRMDDERLRVQNQNNYDEMVKNQYSKLNRKLIINK